MGVRGLLTYLSPIQTTIDLQHYKGWRVSVDTMYVLYLFREDTDALMDYVKGLLAIPLTLTFILDGKADEEKRTCIEKRRDARVASAEEAERMKKKLESPELNQEERADLQKKILQKESDAWQLTSTHKQWFLGFVKAMGCSIVKAEKEADALLASPLYDAVITSDTDILLLGCKRMWVPTVLGLHKQYLEEDMWKILGLDTRHQLLELAFLAGCDVQTKPILPFDKALSSLRFYGSIFYFHICHPEIISDELLKQFVWLCRGVWANVHK